MAADSDVTQQAREWIDRLNAGVGLSGNWRLQVLQKRYRKNAKEGCGHELPMRIRRFVNGCPWALVDEAIRYLISLAPYSKENGTGIVYNGILLDRAYRPTLTQWTRDEQTVVDEQNPRNGTYTLVQDLIEDTECEDSETADTGSSCSETTVTEWHWDDDAPGDLADYVTGRGCEPGVTYAITQVNRKEDGTFDWALVKRVAKTQHSGPVTVECSSDSKTTVETWDNLYGNEDEGYRAEGGCAGDGPVALPGCGDSGPGVRTQVQVTENSDCTLKAVVTRRESFPYTTDWDEGTPCRRVRVTHLFNQKTEPAVPDPDVGETVQAQVSKNEDDSYDAQIRVTAAPDETELHWTDGSVCRPRVVSQYSNMRAMPQVPGIAAGESLSASVRKNDDCTWDATFAVTKPAPEAVEEWDQGSPCRPEHVTSYRNSADRPVIPELKAGRTVVASVSRNDDCTWDGQVTVRDAPEGVDFAWEQGSACRPEHVTRIIRSKTLPVVPAPAAGRTVQASVSKNEDDCTYDATVTVTEPPPEDSFSWEQGTACRKETVTVVRNSRTEPGVPAAKEGETVSAQITRNDDCTYDARIAVAGPEAPADYEWTSGDGCREHETTRVITGFLTPEQAAAAVPPAGDNEVVNSVVRRMQDCTYDVQYTVASQLSKDTGWLEWDSEQRTQGGFARFHHGVRYFFNVETVPVPDRGSNVTISVDLNRFCRYDGHMAYNDMYEWETDGSGHSGGISEGKTTLPQLFMDGKNQLWSVDQEFSVVKFYGSGNEATEASRATSGYISVGSRMYAMPESGAGFNPQKIG